jgi:hypothetical protein
VKANLSDTALRLRVERLLRDDFRPEDLTALFLALRFRSFGRETVIEIGDFVAHADERNKGAVTQVARDFFTVARLSLLYIGRTLDPNDLPASIPSVLEATFRQLDDSILVSDTGLTRETAKKKLALIVRKMKPNAAGRIAVWAELDETERSIVLCLTRLVVKPAFDDNRLFREFSGALLKNDLLAESEMAQFSRFKPAVSLFAMSVMHQCRIDLGDGTTALLQACSDDTLNVVATAEAESPRKKLNAAATMFTTALRGAEYCDPELLKETSPSRPCWHHPIELTTGKKLAKIG